MDTVLKMQQNMLSCIIQVPKVLKRLCIVPQVLHIPIMEKLGHGPKVYQIQSSVTTSMAFKLF